MHAFHDSFTRKVALVLLGLACLAGAAVPRAAAQALAIGQQRPVKTSSIRIAANWNDGWQFNEQVWQPEPGWVVVGEVRFVEESAAGRYGTSADYVQANSSIVSTREIQEAYNSVRQYTGNFGISEVVKIDVFKKLQEEEQRRLSSSHQFQSTHRALRQVVQAKGAGNYFDQKGSWIQGHWEFTEMYVGDSNELAQRIEELRRQIEQIAAANSQPPPSLPAPSGPVVRPGDLAGEWIGSNKVRYTLTPSAETFLGLPCWNWTGKALLYKGSGVLSTDGKNILSIDAKTNAQYDGTLSDDLRVMYFPALDLTLRKR